MATTVRRNATAPTWARRVTVCWDCAPVDVPRDGEDTPAKLVRSSFMLNLPIIYLSKFLTPTISIVIIFKDILNLFGPTFTLSARSSSCTEIFQILREKERDLTQSYDGSPYVPTENSTVNGQHKNAIKLRLHNYCGPT